MERVNKSRLVNETELGHGSSVFSKNKQVVLLAMACLICIFCSQNQTYGQATSLLRRVVKNSSGATGGAGVDFDIDAEAVGVDYSFKDGMSSGEVIAAAGGATSVNGIGDDFAIVQYLGSGFVLSPLEATTFVPQVDATSSLSGSSRSDWTMRSGSSSFYPLTPTSRALAYYDFETLDIGPAENPNVFNTFSYVVAVPSAIVNDGGDVRLHQYNRTRVIHTRTEIGGSYLDVQVFVGVDNLYDLEVEWRDGSGTYEDYSYDLSGVNVLIQAQLPLSGTPMDDVEDVIMSSSNFTPFYLETYGVDGVPGTAQGSVSYSGSTWGFAGLPLTPPASQALAASLGEDVSQINLNAIPEPSSFVLLLMTAFTTSCFRCKFGKRKIR